MFIDVIMPCFNAERYICESIKSILCQKYKHFNLIIVNDGSNDNTLNIINRIKDSRIKVINQKNSGVAFARNRGINTSRCALICFCDADDIWVPEKLSKQVYTFIKTNADLIFSDVIYFDEKTKKRFMHKWSPPYVCSSFYEKLLIGDFIPTSTVMLKRQALLQLHPPGFSKKYFGTEDWDLWIRVAKKGYVYKYNYPLAYYRIHEQGISKNFDRHHKEELKVIKNHLLKKNNFPTAMKNAALYNWEKKEVLHYLKCKKIKDSFFCLFKIVCKYGIMLCIKDILKKIF